jgi:uncharacterized RDD family membrane protein YckC
METNPPAASLIKRYAALVYELLLLLALLFVADYLFISLTHNAHSPGIKTALQIYLLGVTGIYFIWMWMRGQSLAMKTWHIRLVTVDNKPLSFPRATLRFVLAVGLIGISQLWAWVDRDHQFLHDRLSGTRLIQSKHRQTSQTH